VPGGTTHLWEESWDDDDTNEDFAVQLKYVDAS
jgi:26 proteasome complex subunit DSS1